MRIVVVSTFFPNAAQPQRTLFVAHLTRAIAALRDVQVVAPVAFAPPWGRIPRWAELNRVPRVEMLESIRVRHPRFLVLPKLAVLTAAGYAAGILRTIRAAAAERPAPLLHAHCAFPDGVGVAIVARLLGLPYVVTAHGSDLNVYAARGWLRPQIRWALRGARGIITVSEALRAKATALIGKEGPPVAVIPCAGFDPGVFSLPGPGRPEGPSVAAAPSPRKVLYVGNLVAIKAVHVLIHAWTLLEERGALESGDRLVIVGDGPERRDLEALAARSSAAAKIEFLGRLAQAEVARCMGEARVLCLPSLNEGTPNVVIEALARGVPVVASQVGGIPDIVREGHNGALAPPGDPPALAEALLRVDGLRTTPEALRASVAHLTWAELARKNCAFLDQVLAAPSGQGPP